MNIAITGSSGFIGSVLTNYLIESGETVTRLPRQNINARSNIRTVTGDLVNDVSGLADFVKNASVIYHCAGEVKRDDLMYDLHVSGTRNLLRVVHDEIVRTGKPIHWVQLSSTGAYGVQRNNLRSTVAIDETFSPKPENIYEITKTISDELVVNLAQIQPLFTYTIVRPSIVIGDGMPNSSFYQMTEIVRKKLFFYIGSKNFTATYVHVEDVVRLLVLCSKSTRAIGQTFIISNDCLMSDLISSIAKAHGVSRPKLVVPEFLVRGIVKILPSFIPFPLTSQRVDALTRRAGYNSVHLQRTLDFQFEHPIPDIVERMIFKNVKSIS
ncbi:MULTISPECIES: NAD-dependent epimerase/dehydratase family protein [unclassified Pseudomonas]|uniref:NAD-dependent epimerase/dehydratase family protein n=1 Tax=unclassified Pseudomonas TaxID=196821 RepID=UPI00147493AF|nr:NAD-dependent epimerase/dehydratase family protein [Pseudomonas sp. WS 5078]NMY61507.1 NAD-dependent epimerase/dehydratase family protein [Pseudomonas sp. WS 5354]